MSASGPPLPALDRPGAFAAPWEAQIFAVVLKLYERGLFDWHEFASRLSAEIHAHPDEAYYRCWHDATVELLMSKGLIDETALLEQARAVERYRRSDHHHVARTEPIAVVPPRR